MRWFLKLYLASLGYSYFFAPPLTIPPRNIPHSYLNDICRLQFERAPQSATGSVGAALHLDESGLIVQDDGDGGDTAQRTGMLYYRLRDQAAFERALNRLEVAPGVYVRHPFQEGFRSDPNEFSRDQQRPLVIALGSYGLTDRLWRLATAQFWRAGKYQNKDYLGPVNVGEYIRAFHAWPLYPVLIATDAGLLASSIHIVVTGAYDDDDVDDNNHLMSLLQAKDVLPTPLGWLARRVYKSYRPRNLGNSILGESDPVQGAVAWYHRAGSGGNPFIAESYRNAIRDL